MVSQALWLKSSPHLQSDATQRGQNGETGLVVAITTPPTSWWHTMRPEWWARPCGWNNHSTYTLMAHKEARMVSQALWLKLSPHSLADDTQRGQNGEPGLVVEIITPLTSWWHTKRPEWWARLCGWNNHTTYFLMVYKKFKFRWSMSIWRTPTNLLLSLNWWQTECLICLENISMVTF